MNTELPEHKTLPGGTVAHYDDATGAWWEVSREDWLTLVAALESGEHDAYSHWCNRTESTMIHGYDASDLGLW